MRSPSSVLFAATRPALVAPFHVCARPRLAPGSNASIFAASAYAAPALQARCWRFPRRLMQCPQLAVLPLVCARQPREVDFPCVCIGVHSHAPPHLCVCQRPRGRLPSNSRLPSQPRLYVSTPEGSTSLASASGGITLRGSGWTTGSGQGVATSPYRHACICILRPSDCKVHLQVCL